MNRATEFPGYPFGWIRDWLDEVGVADALDDVEAESIWLSAFAQAGGWYGDDTAEGYFTRSL